MAKSIYSNDGEIRIYVRKNKHIDTIQLIRNGEKRGAVERKIATDENIDYYKKQGLKAWNRLIMPKEVREVKTLTEVLIEQSEKIQREIG